MSTSITEAEEAGPRKGRSNAILTYELLAEFDQKLTVAVTKIDAMASRVSEAAEKHQDHEVRLRALELTSATMMATSNTAKGLGQWGWLALFTLINTAIAIVTLFLKTQGASP